MHNYQLFKSRGFINIMGLVTEGGREGGREDGNFRNKMLIGGRRK